MHPDTQILSTVEKIRESNRIERIYRQPTLAEITQFESFMKLGSVTVGDLQQFVSVYQPGAVLRTVLGQEVWIGGEMATPGGPMLVQHLTNFLESCNRRQHAPLEAHSIYEMIHPFTDGNGRSGRMLWYWMMARSGQAEYAGLGFLHMWYYQSLEYLHDAPPGAARVV